MNNSLKCLAGLFALLLSSCGGGGGGSSLGGGSVAEGGIGGTGISSGPVTGFGSIFVNGIEYETDDAILLRDGVVASTQGDFSIGEYVTVSGTVNPDGKTGTAIQVEFADVLEGPVTTVSADGIRIEVMGQTVITDRLTVLIGFDLLTDLADGNMLEISGTRNASNEIIASAIKLKSAAFVPGTSELEITGPIDSVNSSARTFVLGGLTVDYASASFNDMIPADLSAGRHVEVKSNQALSGSTLIASRVEPASAYPEYDEDTEVEIEGVITRFASSSDFDVNGLSVTTNNRTEFEDGAPALLALDVRVEVEGVINATGTLVAEEVSIRNSGDSIELEAAIDSVNAATGRITLLGNTIIVNSSTMLIDHSVADIDPLTLNDLNPGDLIEVRGNLLNNGDIIAVRIDREDPNGGSSPDTELEGKVSAKDESSGTLVVLGITVVTDNATQFVDHSDNPLTSAEFFGLIDVGVSKVHVLGNTSGSSQVTATWIKLED